MSRIFIHGLGAVSPAGWGAKASFDAVAQQKPAPLKEMKRPGWIEPLFVRQVPAPSPRPTFVAHPRLRRSSPITQYTVSAALEALGEDANHVRQGTLRLGIIHCVMTGCVNYSRRFYDEALRDPATASPLVFPETVFNAPSSHLASLLETKEINYTLVGDPGTFILGIVLASDWLSHDQVDGCLVIGAEENEWLASDAYRLIARNILLGDGAGALYLRREHQGSLGVELNAVTDSHLFHSEAQRREAAAKVRSQLNALPGAGLLCDGLQNISNLDAAEASAWADWAGARISPKLMLGESLMAAAALQCVLGIEALRQNLHSIANISVVGCNQQAIGAQFRRH